MDGSVTESWFCKGYVENVSGLECVSSDDQSPLCQPTGGQWFHEDPDEAVVLPSWPDELLLKVHREKECRGPDATPGPHEQVYLRRVRVWAGHLVEKFQQGDNRISGAFARNEKAWRKRLRYLPEQERKKWLQQLMVGFELPFDPENQPPQSIHTFRNHADLCVRKDDVWTALDKQLQTGAIFLWDTQGGTSLPRGLSSIRWVEKQGSQKVRITMNARAINQYFTKEACTTKLETINRVCSAVMKDDLMGGFDLSSAYHHCVYARPTWGGFSMSSKEVPVEVWSRLVATDEGAAAVFWGPKGDQRICFCHRGLVMGLAPSCKQFNSTMQVLLRSWQLHSIGAREAWRATVYIDDAAFLVRGRPPKSDGLPDNSSLASFRNAVELTLRILAEFIILGFSVNFRKGKSELTPSCTYTHLGVRFSTRDKMFRLPPSRCDKLQNVLKALHEEVQGPLEPQALTVASVIGSLWSINVVAHTSTAILCRQMTLTIAKLLGVPELKIADKGQLARMLKRVWKGHVVWTTAANEELLFWLEVDFSKLEAHMAYDCFDADIEQVCVSPKDWVLHDSVTCLAVDSSDTSSGGGQFISKGNLWQLDDHGLLHVLLSESEVGASSTFRELTGVFHALVACAKETEKVLVMCDNLAVSQVLRKGSRIPQLQDLFVRIFKLQLRRRMVVRCQWLSRNEKILVIADAASRLQGCCEWHAPALLFWRAQQLAVRTWGSGITFDRFASTKLSQPIDCGRRLPFNTRFRQPHSSGVDAFQQRWSGHINWVNAPFVLLNRIFDLLEAQEAVAVVVVPLRTSHRWSGRVRQGAMGLRKLWSYNCNLPAWRMVGLPEASSPYRAGFGLALVDYRREPSSLMEFSDAGRLRWSRGHRVQWDQDESLRTAMKSV